MNDKFYIWSIEHGSWWKAAWGGYTTEKSNAGVYSYEEACGIVENANKHTGDEPYEAMVKVNS